jgi:spoIIIJ-associated protein
VAHAEASARTVEAAVSVAAAQLGLRPDQVDIEVLEDPVPSTFGYIGSPARVRVTPRASHASAAASRDKTQVAPPPDAGLPESRSPEGADLPGIPEGAGLLGSLVPGQSALAAGAGDLATTRDPASSPDTTNTDQAPGTHGAESSAPAVSSSVGSERASRTPRVEATPVPAAQPAAAAESTPSPAVGAAEQDERLEGASGAGQLTPSGGTPETATAVAAGATASNTDGSTSAASNSEPSSATKPQRRSFRDEPIEPAMVEADTERAGDFLEGLLDALDVDGDITTWVDEVGGHSDLEGSDLDMLVGANGETLDALQELTRLAVLRQSKRRVRLLLDINGYRARHREQLVSVVRATAEQVIRSREDHEFEPMTPAERKIVHDAVAAIDGVRTESLGEEPYRRVIIQPT